MLLLEIYAPIIVVIMAKMMCTFQSLRNGMKFVLWFPGFKIS